MACDPPPGAPTPFGDALTAPSGDDLLPAVLAQTPRGRAWRTDAVADADHSSFMRRFWRAACEPLADLYHKMWKLAAASTACTLSGPEDPANDALGDWEREFGLPDPCLAGVTLTTERRKLLLRMRVAAKGGQSIAFFTCLAATLGYTVVIREVRVFRCGAGRCGGDPIGSPVNELIWIVNVESPGVSYFRCGAGRCGRDPLGSMGRRRDLECMFEKWKPAHTQVRFRYRRLAADWGDGDGEVSLGVDWGEGDGDVTRAIDWGVG